MNDAPRRGLSIPSITVLDAAGRVIEAEQRRVFRHNAQQGYGADIIFGVGTTGEWNRISNRERQRLILLEVDEVAKLNRQIKKQNRQAVEAWVGVTAETCSEALANIVCALEAGADAAVIAPLSIADLSDMQNFFQRQVSNLFDYMGKSLPLFLYDNADLAVDPKHAHLRTRDVKKLSRLPFIRGIKVSASRKVLGNYTKGALHFKDKGEFGIYIGNAMLMFQVFHLEDGISGLVREYWNRYLLHNELPIGVVSGPANVLPREWQRAWRAAFTGDQRLMQIYRTAFEQFGAACKFGQQEKLLACLKYALKLDGVIESDRVAAGTPSLTDDERSRFARQYIAIKAQLAELTDGLWHTHREEEKGRRGEGEKGRKGEGATGRQGDGETGRIRNA
ncbi:MAG: dihydrodipicolinate synthase family protein [Acidobacteria bacterium]|nr:dihydrodipicolinate synthase family protein [Acidobacteriota bacterium]